MTTQTETDPSVAIKAQNPDLATAWQSIAWWERTCEYWQVEAKKGYALRDRLAAAEQKPDTGDVESLALTIANLDLPSLVLDVDGSREIATALAAVLATTRP